jgi:hypothetical protein
MTPNCSGYYNIGSAYGADADNCSTQFERRKCVNTKENYNGRPQEMYHNENGMHGNMNGNMHENMHGNMNGNMHGNMHGNKMKKNNNKKMQMGKSKEMYTDFCEVCEGVTPVENQNKCYNWCTSSNIPT